MRPLESLLAAALLGDQGSLDASLELRRDFGAPREGPRFQGGVYAQGTWYFENSIDRYSLGGQNDLTVAGDGSITLYLQAENPGGEMEANWLPSTQNGDPFYLLFRAYYPDSVMYTLAADPEYAIPPIQRAGPLLPGDRDRRLSIAFTAHSSR